jgi:hypothetical protein
MTTGGTLRFGLGAVVGLFAPESRWTSAYPPADSDSFLPKLVRIFIPPFLPVDPVAEPAPKGAAGTFMPEPADPGGLLAAAARAA